MNNQDKAPQDITPNLPLWSYQLQQNSKLAVKTRKDLEIYLITRALKDEKFRQDLVANPKAIVEKELGKKLPEELKIKVLEETENTIYMVFPCNPYEGLPEEELRASLGMTYEDVAQWVLDQQRSVFIDKESSVKLIAQAWRNEVFKHALLHEPITLIQEMYGDNILEALKGIKLQVYIESINTLCIVVPHNLMLSVDSIVIYEEVLNMPMVIGCASNMTSCCMTNNC